MRSLLHFQGDIRTTFPRWFNNGTYVHNFKFTCTFSKRCRMTPTFIVTILLLLIAGQDDRCMLVPEVSEELSPSTFPIRPKHRIRRFKRTLQLKGNCFYCLQHYTVCPSGCCTRKWHPCNSRKPCCNPGWKCVRWFWGRRCEPAKRCVWKWRPCTYCSSLCCNGWRCKRRGRAVCCEALWLEADSKHLVSQRPHSSSHAEPLVSWMWMK